MKFHAGDLLVCKLGDARYLSGIISKVTYKNEEDYNNGKALYINVSCYRKKIYISELEGKEICVIPAQKIDEFVFKFYKQWQEQ